MAIKTFIIDCPWCRAKVAAEQTGKASEKESDESGGPAYEKCLYVGTCLSCGTCLAGETHQVSIAGYDADEDTWSDVVRIYPKPAKTFSSYRIPRVVKDSLREADMSLQAGAHTASCVMLGRALEALCRDILEPANGSVSTPSITGAASPKPKKKMMLGEGIRKLKDGGHIDDRLYDWSQHLNAFRNIAAHPDEMVISRQDAEDLQAFTDAIIEYIYDLSDRYEEFKARLTKAVAKKK